MFGYEFADKNKHHRFPEYEKDCAVDYRSIETVAPLVWQEHCVECAMPACYGTCSHYIKRSDGRCRRFKYGIEKFKNKDAIFGRNVTIEMNEWAKLETFFFTAGYSYSKVQHISTFLDFLSEISQRLPFGKLKRFCYYIKEFYIRQIGDRNHSIPRYLLCEFYNDSSKPYQLNLENRANNKIVYRTSLNIKEGYNRFWIPSIELNFQKEFRNYLCIYPEGNVERVLNIISLELISIKQDYFEQYFPQSYKKVKCVVWDLDDTIWDGILGEDGIEGVVIKEKAIAVIKELDSRGILNSISSKNDEEKVVEALKKYHLFKYFVCPMVNWNPKSENIKKIAQVLDISIDTFVFVDDSPFELNEVKENCPGIRVCDAADIESYVQQDCFDVPVTEESKRRRESYREISIRNQAAARFHDDITGFLCECHMIVHVKKPNEEELMRCYELIQRTNQLNISAERLSLKEVKEMVNSSDYDCYRIKVNDKYGNYGLVGFAAFDISDNSTVVLRHFVFSCRAARKKIEESFFEYMIKKYRSQGFKKLALICRITEKNQLMQKVLEESGLFEKEIQNSTAYLLQADLEQRYERLNIMKIEED